MFNNIKPYLSKFLIAAFSIILTAIVGWYIPIYLEKNEVTIETLELQLNGGRYLYLFDISNSGVNAVDGFGLEVRSGEVTASIFDGDTTTRSKHNDKSYNPNIIQNDFSQYENINSINLKLFPGMDSKVVGSADSGLGTNEEKQSNSWYQINIGQIYLGKDRDIKASVISNIELSENDIRCLPAMEGCRVESITTMPKDKFENIFKTLSVERSPIKNKIYATGIGVSSNPIQGAALVEARNKSVADAYKYIVQILYGIEVDASERLNEANKSAEYSADIKLSAKGVLDKNSFYIYSESSSKLASGEVMYEIKAYYELPWELQSKAIQFKYDGLVAVEDEPVELSGKKPAWVDGDFDNVAGAGMYAVGISEDNIPYAIAKRISRHRAISELSRSLSVKIESLIKNYNEESTDSVGINPQVNNALSNVRTFAYYRSEEKVYALVGLGGS